MREAGLAGRREGRKREGGWPPSELAAAPSARAVVREGSPGDAAGGCVVEEAGAAERRRPAGLPAERAHCRRGGAEGAPGYSPVLPVFSPLQ